MYIFFFIQTYFFLYIYVFFLIYIYIISDIFIFFLNKINMNNIMRSIMHYLVLNNIKVYKEINLSLLNIK